MKDEIQLSDEQIASYHENGFLRLDEVTMSDEIETFLELYDRLFSDETTQDDRKELGNLDEEGRETLPQILGPHELAPELLETQFFENARAVAKQLLGEEADYTGDHAILKPARFGTETPWHQDEAYWNPALTYQSLSFWMPFQEATVENGCMQFVPGSHELPVLPHHPIPGEGEALEVDDPDQYTDEVVGCELPPGGATVHDSRTLHYTGPNRTDVSRRAYVLTFGLPTVERESPRDFYWLEE